MYLAKNNPEKIGRCITLASKYYRDEMTSAKEIKKLDPIIIQQKIPAFADQLRRRHVPQDWEIVLKKTAELLGNLAKSNALQLSDYATINIPVLLLIGDRDNMITLEETLAVFDQLPNAEMGVLPATAHPIEQVDTSALAFLINKFLKKATN